MAYHVSILKFEGTPADFCALPRDWQPPSLGDAEEVRAKISSVWPDVDWSHPPWGRVVLGQCSVEIQIAAAGPVKHFRLNIRGGGDPLRDVSRLCKSFGWAAIDGSRGKLLDLDEPDRTGLHNWQRYAMGIVRDPPDEEAERK